MPTSQALIDRVREGLSLRFEVERELGRGGRATVFLARDLAHDRHVAIKVLHRDIAAGFEPERFLREIKLLATLQHPHILPLHDSGLIGETPYYVMPFVAGESLRDRLNREGALPLPLALRIAAESASALDYAHRQGVIHRDIKPENILLSDDHVLIADFGIARAAAQSADESLTQTSMVIGTPAYMSPEQASGETRLDGRSDIYSLACVLFEMISGRTPFSGATPAAVMASRFRGDVPRISEFRSGIPRQIERALSSALSLSPDDRPSSAGAFAEMLAGDAAVPRARRKWSRVQIVSAGLTLGVAAAGLFAWRAATVRGGSGKEQASVAVLPFQTVGGQTGDEYFAAGMTDEMVSALSTIRGLRVAAEASTQAAARTITDASELGRKLNVRTLLSGSVRRQGDSLRVTARLIDAPGGFVIRSFRVDRGARDVFAVQDEIARMITGALSVDLGERGSRPLVKRATRDAQAHDLLLQGRYLARRGDTVTWGKALELFRAALARDSLYAEAWAAIADVHSSRGIGNQAAIPPRPEFEQARIAAARALAIDSMSAEAHDAMSLVQMMYDYDWAGAEASLNKAHDADPGYDMTYLHRAFLLSWLGKFDEATASTREALHMDPSSNTFRRDIGRTLLLANRTAEAEATIRETLASDSTNTRARMLLGQALMMEGRAEEAVRELERSVRRNPTTRGSAFLAAAYEAAGRHRDARRVVDSLVNVSSKAFVPAMDFAIAYAGLHDKDNTLTWLERAYDDRTLRPFLRDWVFTFVRNEPRYRALFAKMRLPFDGK